MIRLATVIDAFETDFLAQYRHKLSFDHLRALAAMTHCRTQSSLKMQVKCTECEHQTLVPHSCGHRHCPHCQHHESQQWLERQMKKQVPAEYFLMTFTLPAEFRALAFAHQRVVYELLMRCSWETVRTFSQNDKQLQGTPGAIAVLHTNTRRLDYHPHVHLVMPAAAINGEDKRWRTKRPGKGKGGYLFCHKALAKVFRAKLLAGIEAAGLTLPGRYPEKWVVDCKSVGTGEPALIYLGRYLYRGVIREKDIVACGDGLVCFRYQNAKTGRMEQRTVSGADFLWLVLQHVLPKGFRRARNYGFLHPNCKRLIALLHLVLKFAPGRSMAWVKERAPILCSCCGALMVIVRTRLRSAFSGGVPVPIATQGAL
ncbi:MAG: transposase [Uliginosibacterium sp.]|nr:transposase [Uliginosibacterium sp.]